jgi:hypothetical protein
LGDELKVAPNMCYRWQQELFANAHLSCDTVRNGTAVEATMDRTIEQLKSGGLEMSWLFSHR